MLGTDTSHPVCSCQLSPSWMGLNWSITKGQASSLCIGRRLIATKPLQSREVCQSRPYPSQRGGRSVCGSCKTTGPGVPSRPQSSRLTSRDVCLLNIPTSKANTKLVWKGKLGGGPASNSPESCRDEMPGSESTISFQTRRLCWLLTWRTLPSRLSRPTHKLLAKPLRN